MKKLLLRAVVFNDLISKDSGKDSDFVLLVLKNDLKKGNFINVYEILPRNYGQH